MSLPQYPSGQAGRIPRLRFFLHTILFLVISFVVGVIIGLANQSNLIGWFGFALALIYIYFPVRGRLHDMGNSGWWAMLMLVPVFNLALWLFLLFMPGNRLANKFGPPT
ncbi:MAG: hypothetical protein BZY88_19505 [SAR202 cluster bacterium Io17-Chloro-G9]|nr:MAG: hypothetical protein BZY88_19505 [SAR202 cluster bacterium Io17-Chloro-G9]